MDCLPSREKNNGYRLYTDEDIKRLKIIRSLRCANYSLEAILRLLQQLSKNPNTDVRAVHKSVKNGQLKKRASYGRIDIYLQLP